MPKPRKTIKIAELVDTLNASVAYNAQHHPEETAGRMALCQTIEHVLHMADAYGGFRYLDGHEAVIAGTHDESARYYFMKEGSR